MGLVSELVRIRRRAFRGWARGEAGAALMLALGALSPWLHAQPTEGTVETIPVESVEDGEREPLELGDLTVEGEAIAAPRYTADSARAATKTDTPLIETPQAVSVLSSERLQDLGALSVQDALRYSAGVRSDAYGFDTRGDFAIIRGTQFAQYQDGLRSLFGSYNNVRPDVYALELVTIVRGPSSVLYGQGPSGGMVDLTSKRPRLEAAHELRAEVGSYQRRQIALDSTGPLTESGNLAYRLVALVRQSGTQVDFVDADRWFVAPSVRWAPTDWLRWTVLGHFQKDESGSSTAFLPWEGTVLPNRNGRIPTSRFVSEPGFDRYDTEQQAVTSLLEIDLGAHWTFHQNARYSDSGAVYRSMFPNIYTGDPYLLNPLRRDSVLRVSYIDEPDVHAVTADQRVTGRWRWGAVANLLLAGVDITHVETTQQEGRLPPLRIVAQGLFDLYEPEYGDFIAPEVTARPELTTRQTGYYLQNQMRIGEHLVALAGVRFDTASSEEAGNPDIEDEETSLRGGLLYHFDAGFAPYVSYAESFEPVADYDGEGEPFEPVIGRQFEAGLKYQSRDAGTLLTAAWFDIEEENRLAPGPDPAVQVQLGEARIRGFEFEATSTWRERLDLIAAYTRFVDAYSDEGPNAEGAGRKPLSAVADDQASLFGRLRFGLFGVPGFSIGAGLRYTAAIPDQSRTVEVPSTTLFDAMAAFESTHWRVAVNASNLEDETVLAVCLERGDCFYGARRTVVGSVAYRF